MAQTKTGYKLSKYKYVNIEPNNGRVYYRIGVPNYSKKRFNTEREAAIAVDKILIEQGKEPVNILKKIVKPVV